MRVFIKHISQMPAIHRLYLRHPKEFGKATWLVNLSDINGVIATYDFVAKPTKRQVRKLVKQAKRSRYLFF